MNAHPTSGTGTPAEEAGADGSRAIAPATLGQTRARDEKTPKRHPSDGSMHSDQECFGMRATNLLAAIVAPVLLAACATSGTHRYSCGVPDGPACQSVLTTYAQTHGHVAPVPTNPGPVAGARAPFRTALRLAQNLEGDLVFEAEEDRKSRSTPDSVPEREPAVVMRIWIAPWQDARGDLHGATYRYTEIAPARWRYGNVPVEPRTPFHRVGTATSGHATNTDPETHPAAEEAP